MPILDSEEYSNKLQKFKNLDMDEFNLYKLATVQEYNKAQVISQLSSIPRLSVSSVHYTGVSSVQCQVSSVECWVLSVDCLVTGPWPGGLNECGGLPSPVSSVLCLVSSF